MMKKTNSIFNVVKTMVLLIPVCIMWALGWALYTKGEEIYNKKRTTDGRRA